MNLKNAFFSEKKRYLTGIVLIAILVLCAWINNSYLIWLILGICYFVGFKESLKLFECEKSFFISLLAICVWISVLFNSYPIESGIFFAMLLAGLIAYKPLFDIKYTFAFIYPTIPFLTLFTIYRDFGIETIIWLIAIVALCDTAAYFGGRVFGKTPLSPTSPKKTIEGLIIGIAFSVSIGSVFGIGILHQNFFNSLIVSFLVSLAGVFGDLFESYLKRRVNIKDSGNFLPGHGGILDRFDAILFGAVTMHFILHFFSTYKTNTPIIF